LGVVLRLYGHGGTGWLPALDNQEDLQSLGNCGYYNDLRRIERIATSERINQGKIDPIAAWFTGRNGYFAALILGAALVFFRPLFLVLRSSVSVDQYSQILIIAPISVVLIYLERNTVFARVQYSWMGAAGFAVCVVAYLCIAALFNGIPSSVSIALSILLFSGACIAAFLCVYGRPAFRAALFPLFFLFLMTPLPDGTRDRLITFLQRGSAVGTDWFFTAANVPFTREGVIIALPSVTIEIAQECSGIRSSLILIIAGLVLGHLFLNRTWSKIALLIVLIPLTIAKNAFRIFTLSVLGIYVNPSFLSGRLHHQGGIVFFAVSFVALWGLVWLLQKLEGQPKSAKIVQEA
jgi:exosortase